MKVIPLITGSHTVTKTPFGTLLPGHTGSVTLLRKDKHAVLVDTGSRGMFMPLKLKLKEQGLKPADITMVILTHLHLDHSFNVGRFPNARIFAWSHEWREIETLRIEQMDGFRLLDDITILQTPGHAEEHISVIVKDEDNRTVVISGDAVNEQYYLTKKLSAFAYDPDLYHKNAERLLRIADTIIPGHGRIFYPS